MIRRLFINIPICALVAIVLISQTILARQLEWQWQNPVFQGNHLYALWSPSEKQLIAGGALGTIIAFDGTQWIEHHVETLQTIKSIWADDQNCVAVGDMGQAIHFTDDQSRILTISQHPLNAIWAIDKDNIFAFGNAGTIYHYSDHSWHAEQSPTKANLMDAIGFGQHIYVAGTAGTFLHFDATNWHVINTPKKVDFKGIWGMDQNLLYLCGTYLDAEWHQKSCVYSYDGITWKELGTFDDNVVLTHIWGDNNHVYVTGDKGRIFLFQNSQWNQVFENSQALFRLTRMDSGFVAVGENGQFVRENDSIWIDDIDSPNHTINAIWGDSSHTFAVCQSGEILALQNNEWRAFNQPTSKILNDISGNEKNLFVVGESGFMAAFDGQFFTQIESPTTSEIFAISVINETAIAVGDRGLVMHYVNNSWELKDASTTQTLFDIWAYSENCMYAVGKSGTVIRFDGTSWQTMVTPTSEKLYAVWGTGPNQVFAAGKYGVMIQFDGVNWYLVENFPTSENIMSMWGQGNRLYAAGNNGSLCTYDGNDWQLVQSPCVSDINTVWGRSDKDIFIGGANGSILHYPYQVPKTLQLVLPNNLPENIGKITGQILVCPASDEDLSIQIQTSLPEHLIVPQSIILPSGYTMSEFEITVVDNRKHDGLKQVNIEAKANDYVPSVVSIKIVDNESDRGIWVIDHFPDGNTPMPIDHVTIRFNRDIDIQSFNTDDIVLTGPRGLLVVQENVEWNLNTVSIFFESQETTGSYTILVGPEIYGNEGSGMDQDGDDQFCEIHDDVYMGHFVLEDQTGPYVVEADPINVETDPLNRVKGPIEKIVVTFNEDIEESSLTIHDIDVIKEAEEEEDNDVQIPIESIVKLDTYQYEIYLKMPIETGIYKFILGPEITDLAGNLMHQYIIQFIIDNLGPRISFNSLFGKQNKAISYFDLTFNETIDTNTFTTDTISIIGPQGQLTKRIESISDDAYRIFISQQYFDAIFEVVIQPSITDLAGNLMDQDKSGTGGEISDRYEFSIQQELPDLIVSQINFAPEAKPGGNIEINWVVQNNGLGSTSGEWQDEIYLLETPFMDNYTKVTSVNTQISMKNATHYFRSVSISVPDINETHFWIGIKTNANNTLDENIFENNQTISAYPFWNTQRAYPDLKVSDIIVPQTMYVGEPVRIAWNVVNQGNGPTSATVWMDRVILSTDNVLDDHDIELANIRNPDFLASGEKYVQEHEIILSSDIVENSYYIFIQTDAADQVEEFDQESNNIIISENTVNVQVPVPGKLIVTSFSAPDQASPGDNIQLTWTVLNVGQATIASTNHMILLSKNRLIEPEKDAILLWTSAEKYNPGQPYTLSYSVKMPSLIEMGSYYLIPATNSSMYLDTPVAAPITVTTHIFPDLIVSENMDFPKNLKTDQLLTISWQVVNDGPGSTLVSNWLDYVYLSEDQENDENNIFLGSSRHEMILDASNGQVQVIKTFKIPEFLNGSYYVCVHTDALQAINESNEQNNFTFSKSHIDIQHKQTDLTVFSANTPYSAITGQLATIQWQVKNLGPDPNINNSWLDRIYLSSDERLDNNDILLGEIANTIILDAFQSIEKTITTSIPPLMDGDYYAIIFVDAQNTIYEADAEQNNIFVIPAPIHIHHLFPDLRIETIQMANSSVLANDTITFSYTLINDGQTDTYGTWIDRFYLSRDNNLNMETDTMIGEIEHHTQIAAGSKTYVQTDQLMIPAQISGMYTIFVQVDALNQLYEYQDENNNQASVSVNISDSPADLRVTNIRAPEEVHAGTAIYVSWDVLNAGNQDTREAFWYDRIYLSRDTILSPDYDIELGNIIHKQPLKAGESYTCAQYFVIRQDLAGLYNILVQTDAQNQVYENNQENNNIVQGQSSILLIGVYVDLIVSELQFNKQSWAGQITDISWTVKNNGPDSTHVSSWEDIIYLSSDEIPDINDTVLGVYQHNGTLNVDETYNKTKTIQMPKDLNGNYYVIVKTDANVYNDVYENQAEDNNFVFDEIVVDKAPMPNLSVTDMIVPEQVWSGQYIRIEWTVENNGAIAVQPETGFWYDSVYLSRDPFLDVVHDIPVGNVMFDGTLDSHSSAYTQVLETMLPPGISGPYYVIVLVDSSIPRHVYESNRNDNVYISNNTIDIQLTPPSDLLVTCISTPDKAMIGQMIEWQFEVKNNGIRSAVGSWYDTLYLSSDEIWDIDDLRVARYYHEGDISTGNAYTAVVFAKVPTAISGEYHVIVRTDILNDIRETNEQNNLYVSPMLFRVENSILENADIIQDRISRGEFRYYQINIQQDEDIELLVNGPSAQCSEIFLGKNYIPKRSLYDQRGILMDNHLVLNQSGLSQGIYYVTLYSQSCDNADYELSLNYLVNLRIHELSVSKATNIGMSTLQIEGAHFQPDIQVRLTRDNVNLDRVRSINVLNSGQISLTLDLNDLNEGMYQIVLENPDNETAQTAFEVVNDRRGELFARLLIPGYVSQNKIYQFTLEYGNIGHSDILAPLLVISAGEGGLLRKDIDDEFSIDPIQILGISDHYPVDVLPPHSFYTIKFEFMLISEDYVPFYIQIMDQPDEPIDWDGLHTRLKPEQIEDNIWEVLFGQFRSNMGSTWGDYVNQLRQNAVTNANYGITTRDVHALLPNLSAGRKDITISLPLPPGTRRTNGGSIAPAIADVHDNLTSIGTGTLHHILFDGTVEYTIRFENKSSASASAQYIQIDDLLNEKFDINTFELKEIALGENQINITDDHSYYHTRLDLRSSGQDLFVDIEAGINYYTRMARWIFSAIDPKTGEQSEDPLNGFLPPNESDHKGEGYVRFQIKPQSDIESGTIINNMATIIFDRNEPVDTPIAYHTIDLSIPESHVELISPPNHLEIPLRWGGQDTRNGSGIATYEIYVADNEQAYELWLSQTKATSGFYIGKPGHKYSFYSIATDKVGNVESPPPQPDVVVQLDNNLPPNIPVLISPDDNATNVLPTPLLKTGAFTDSDQSNHMATQWQISKTYNFSVLVMDITSQLCLTELTVPYGMLSAHETYYWRACHIDNHASASGWSEIQTFSTTDIAIPVITNETIDLDQNGESDISQTNMTLIEIDSRFMGVQSQADNVTIVTARSIENTFGTFPAEMPYGLISFRAQCPVGAEIDVQLYFSEEIPPNASWYKFDYTNGFIDYSAYTQQNLPGHKITVRLKDGGFGDADGVENGVVVDPGGIGVLNDENVSSGDDSSNCFIGILQLY
jgi:subtilase family serine protease